MSLAVLVQNQNQFLPLLATPAALGVGVTIAAVSLLLGYLKKVSSVIWHDGFATGCLVIWYAYWQPEFGDDAPMFFFFPLYFSLLTSVVTLTLINRSQDFDRESVEHLRYLNKISRFNINAIAAFVLLSLLVTEHYALYPVAMTLFIIRHTMTVCLENIDR
jgi:hypothetical protein